MGITALLTSADQQFEDFQLPGKIGENGKKLIAIMIDGLRWDYFDKFPPGELKGFPLMAEKGVKAEHLEPVFPSLSYPNFYTLATGMYVENHGYVHNYMYDPITKKQVLAGSSPELFKSYWWDDGEPIWVTAEKQGKSAYFWYWHGCEVTIRGTNASYCISHHDVPSPTYSDFTVAIDNALHVLQDDTADVAGIYYRNVDALGHVQGPDGWMVVEHIRYLDREIYRLQIELQRRGMWDCTNVMIFSDHGMHSTPAKNCINVMDYLDKNDFERGDGSTYSPVLNIWANDEQVDNVYDKLIDANVQGMSVYKKADVPAEWHYNTHHRISPLVLVADPGYVILKPGYRKCGYLGNHGFNNTIPEMWGVFYGRGADFKQGYLFPMVSSVELYQIMCKVTDLTPNPEHDGTWDHVEHMMRRRTEEYMCDWERPSDTFIPSELPFIPSTSVTPDFSASVTPVAAFAGKATCHLVNIYILIFAFTCFVLRRL